MEPSALLDVRGRIVHEPDHLHHEAALHRAAALDLGRDPREEALDLLRRGTALTSRRLQEREQVVQKTLGDLAHEMLLGREMIEERLLRDVGGMADLIDLDGLDAVRREQRCGGADDAIVHLADAALASRCGLGIGSQCPTRHRGSYSVLDRYSQLY